MATAAGVLRGDELVAAVAEHGLATTPFLPQAAVDALVSTHADFAGPDDVELDIDYMRVDRAGFRAVSEALRAVLEPHLADLLPAHRPVLSTFVAKRPGERSGMFLHDDRSYVDERRTRALTLWIPLTDVSPEHANGTLEVVPRSHLLPVGLAGSLTPELFRPYEAFLRRHAVAVTATAGDAVVYDTRTLHASGVNHSDEVRLAVVCAVAPVDEPLIHVVGTSRTGRRVHRVTPDFFLDHHPREVEDAVPLVYPVIEELEVEPRLTPDEVAAVYGTAPPTADPVVPDDLRRDADPEVLDALVPGRRRRRRSTRPPVVEEWGAGVVLEPGRRGVVRVRLARGSRAAVGGGPGAGSVRVVEAPAVAAGMRTDRAAANPAPGESYVVDGDGLVLWNDGPGELVLDLVP